MKAHIIVVVMVCLAAPALNAQDLMLNFPWVNISSREIKTVDHSKETPGKNNNVYRDGHKAVKLNNNALISKLSVEVIKLEGNLFDLLLGGLSPTDTVKTLLSLGNFSYQHEIDTVFNFLIKNDTTSSLFVLVEFFDDGVSQYTNYEMKKTIEEKCPGYRHATGTDLSLFRLLIKTKFDGELFLRIIAMGDSIPMWGPKLGADIQRRPLYPSISYYYGYCNFAWQWGQFERLTRILMIKNIPQKEAIELQKWATVPTDK